MKKKTKLVPFVATWIDLKSIVPTEIRQRKDKYRMSSLTHEIFRKTTTTQKLVGAENRGNGQSL